METISPQTQLLIKLGACLAGVSSLLWLRTLYSTKRVEYMKRQEEFDRKIGFLTAYPYTKEENKAFALEHVPEVVKKLRKSFDSGITRSYEWRISQLTKLKRMFEENKDKIVGAAQKDLGKKHPRESEISEYNLVVSELEHVIKCLYDWMKPERVSSTIGILPAASYIHKDPVGVVLIISPWNYPVNLAIIPLIGAIAAGNTVFLKLSRHSTNVGSTLETLIHKYLDRRCVVAQYDGGAPFIKKLCDEKWDHLFFTGSVSVGREIYTKVSKFLTPCTLELGGKNPCIVDKDVNVDLAAKRIVWGKFFNGGQTCVTADYVLCHQDVQDEFFACVKKYITQFYGNDPQKSLDYPRIINKMQATRLAGLMQYGEVVCGGNYDIEDLYIAPTVLKNVKVDSELMTDEIFGPVLPVIPFTNLDNAIDFINQRALPLSLYYFGRNREHQEKVLSSTRSGACLLNEIIIHFSNPNLPFGGVGESGMGKYHGKLTFDTFVHRRAVIKASTQSWLDLPLRYPPFRSAFINFLVDLVTRNGW